MRLFVAVDLPAEARAAIGAVQRRMVSRLADRSDGEPRRASRLKWVDAGQSHVTLVFLGEVEEVRAPSLIAALETAVDLAPFEITLESIGVFPPRGAPRVLWVGVGAGTAPLAALQREVVARAASLGFPVDDRSFLPHLTLARWRESRPADRERAARVAPAGPIARARIDCATLYRSRLTSAGPTYTPLARANLIGPA